MIGVWVLVGVWVFMFAAVVIEILAAYKEDENHGK